MKFLNGLLMVLVALGISLGIIFCVWKFVLPESVVSDLQEAIGSYRDSGITGEDVEIDSEFYPYYEFLSENGKKLYKQVYANALQKETTFRPIVEVSTSEVENVVKLVYYDHPELFWMDSGYSYKYSENDICVQITLKFNELITEEAENLFKERANEIIEEAKTRDTNYGKERYVYFAIIHATDYNEQASVHQSPYSALVNGQSVCAGYARAFQYIMIELGIPTYYCAGMTEGHAWNIVKLDGKCYNVDLTWADKDGDANVHEKYLNRTDESVGYSHRRSGYSVLLPKCTSKTYDVDY